VEEKRRGTRRWLRNVCDEVSVPRTVGNELDWRTL